VTRRSQNARAAGYRRALLVATIGNALEWFDWNTYAIFAAVPMFALIGTSPLALFGVMSLGLVIFAGYGAVAPAAMAELFPTEVRSAGMGLPYSLTVAVFGGTAPYVVQWLGGTGRGGLYPWYLSLLCLVSLVVFVGSRETRQVRLAEAE
jgi:MFS transporter, MHS family, alpha-ketoglutarate permease